MYRNNVYVNRELPCPSCDSCDSPVGCQTFPMPCIILAQIRGGWDEDHKPLSCGGGKATCDWVQGHPYDFI